MKRTQLSELEEKEEDTFVALILLFAVTYDTTRCFLLLIFIPCGSTWSFPPPYFCKNQSRQQEVLVFQMHVEMK